MSPTIESTYYYVEATQLSTGDSSWSNVPGAVDKIIDSTSYATTTVPKSNNWSNRLVLLENEIDKNQVGKLINIIGAFYTHKQHATEIVIWASFRIKPNTTWSTPEILVPSGTSFTRNAINLNNILGKTINTWSWRDLRNLEISIRGNNTTGSFGSSRWMEVHGVRLEIEHSHEQGGSRLLAGVSL